MNATVRTAIFAGVAAASVVAAVGTYYGTRPADVSGFENVGEEFYPEFKDPTKADSLRVVAFDDDKAEVRQFSVELQDGNWVIPSHHDYPAEATDRLAETAASVIGLTRGALKTRYKKQHEEFGVLDPLDEEDPALEGRGTRVRLASGDETLVDLIIGKPVEDQQNTYYVRKADEDEVYVTKLELDVSTKFTDWIEPDLLKLDRDSLNDIVVNNYSIDTDRGRISQPEMTHLSRTSYSDPWTLDGLNEANEEVNTDEVSTLVRNIDDLKIVGVRPKPKGIKPDLTIDQEAVSNQLMLQALRAEMAQRGFFIASVGESDEPRIMSTEGELLAGTNQGVRYYLNFGSLFTGSTQEIEIGGSQSEDEAADDSEDGNDDGDADAGDASADGADDGKPSRFMLVRVEFDESLLGPRPTEPVAPTPPEGYQEESGEEADDDEAAPSEGSAAEGDSDAQASAALKADDAVCQVQQEAETATDELQAQPAAASADDSNQESKPDASKPDASDAPEAEPQEATSTPSPDAADDGADPSAQPQTGVDDTQTRPETAADDAESPAEPDPVAEYKIAKQKYEAALETYRNDLADYERRVTEGKEKVEELNERFGEWYYVISAESFENLRLSRDALVKPRETPETPDAASSESTPGSEAAAPTPPNSAADPETPPSPSTPEATPNPEQPESPSPESPDTKGSPDTKSSPDEAAGTDPKPEGSDPKPETSEAEQKEAEQKAPEDGEANESKPDAPTADQPEPEGPGPEEAAGDGPAA